MPSPSKRCFSIFFFKIEGGPYNIFRWFFRKPNFPYQILLFSFKRAQKGPFLRTMQKCNKKCMFCTLIMILVKFEENFWKFRKKYEGVLYDPPVVRGYHNISLFLREGFINRYMGFRDRSVLYVFYTNRIVLICCNFPGAKMANIVSWVGRFGKTRYLVFDRHFFQI